MAIMMPAISENNNPSIMLFISGSKIIYVNRAPNGSDIADSVV